VEKRVAKGRQEQRAAKVEQVAVYDEDDATLLSPR